MINKKGSLGETMLIPAILFVMVIIAVGVIISVSMVLGSDYEFRSVDAKALNYKIRECFFNAGTFDKIKEDVVSNCNINKNAVENNKMFFKICENVSAEECSSSNIKIASGGSNFEACFFTSAEKNDKYPKCSVSEFIFNGKKYSIITGSNQELLRMKI